MKNTLLIFGHRNPNESQFGKVLLQGAENLPLTATLNSPIYGQSNSPAKT